MENSFNKNGYNRLEGELRKLKADDRPNIIKAISEASELGDLSETLSTILQERNNHSLRVE